MKYRKLGLAIAFSPRLEALLHESARLKKLWQAELVLIHVGDTERDAPETLNALLVKAGLSPNEVKVRWEKGDTGRRILAVCQEEKIDLLMAGALKKENLLQYYLGTIGRKILRKADCSVLLLLQPSTHPKPYHEIVVNAEEGPYLHQTLKVACELSKIEDPRWLHVVREIKMYGLTMTSSEHCSEEEYSQLKTDLVSQEINTVQKLLDPIPHEGLKINIKILAGKSGFEVSQFAIRKQADLLITGAPARKYSILDRIFPHDQEHIFADLPCNLLIVNPGKEAKRG